LATPCEVVVTVVATVFFGNDVFEVKGVWFVMLVNSAILTPAEGPQPDPESFRSVH